MSFHVTHHVRRRSAGIALASLALALLSSGSAGAQRATRERDEMPLVPLRMQWPATTAIAIFDQSNPLIVEATSDGWIVLTPVGMWAEPVENLPTSRLQLTPSGVRKWSSIVRSALAIALDTTAKKARQPRIPQLGHGLTRIVAGSEVSGAAQTQFTFQRCDGVTNYRSLTAEQLQQFLQVLDRAATVAEQGSPRPIPPTLDRPYYASEVSCPAMPMAGNAPSRFPNGMPESQRRYTEVGVRFVVDTSGYVEARTITVLPGAPPVLDHAARELLARWRYRPAVRSGAPVRQVLSTAVVYDPDRPEVPPLPPRVPTRYQAPGYDVNDTFGYVDIVPIRTYLTTSEGWVRVRVGTWNRLGAFSGTQEWFSPDSVETWAARAVAYVANDSMRVRRTRAYMAEQAEVLKHPMGNAYEVRYTAAPGRDTGWAPTAQMQGCGGPTFRAEVLDRSAIERLVAAARRARAERATPREPVDSAYLRGDVACPAILPDVRPLQEELNVWRHQRGPMPRSMESRNARTEVLSSFVVDTSGTPKPSTLITMPGSDPRAVAALRASLDRYHFQPAMRSGVKVSTLVLRNWSFEPRPQCADTYDGLDCARVYSHPVLK